MTELKGNPPTRKELGNKHDFNELKNRNLEEFKKLTEGSDSQKVLEMLVMYLLTRAGVDFNIKFGPDGKSAYSIEMGDEYTEMTRRDRESSSETLAAFIQDKSVLSSREEVEAGKSGNDVDKTRNRSMNNLADRRDLEALVKRVDKIENSLAQRIRIDADGTEEHFNPPAFDGFRLESIDKNNKKE